jgi:type IV pilus assembly protein PilC
MPSYQYRVARADGTTLEGRAEGEDERAVRAQLEGQGFLIFRLRRLGSLPGFLGSRPWERGSVSPQEILVFNQELLALLKAGLPILKVWDLLIDRTRRPVFQTVLRAVRQDIRGGACLSDALKCHPEYFSELYTASVKAGEQAGNLPEVLQRYIAYLKLMIGLRQKMTKAIAYPAFLVVVGVGVIAFMLTYVLPTFSSVYGEAGTDLPVMTKALISLVRIVQEYVLVLVGAVVALAVGFRWWVHSSRGRAVWDRLRLKLPIIGDALVMHHTVQLARTLGTVLAGGTPVVNALQIAGGAVSNRYVASTLTAAADRVREGVSLAAALKEGHILPQIAVEMIAVGEETGSLEAMLRDVAEFQEGELDQRLTQLTTWIEPVLLLIMGVVVGAIVIIMYLPIFQMAGTVR